MLQKLQAMILQLPFNPNPMQTKTYQVMHSPHCSSLYSLTHPDPSVVAHRSAQNLVCCSCCATINDVPKTDTDMLQDPAGHARPLLHPAKLPPDGCSGLLLPRYPTAAKGCNANSCSLA
jgi:hypothetical protein